MMRDTLKVTKGNITLEYIGSTDAIKEIMLDIIELQPKVRVPIKVESTEQSRPLSLTPIEGVKKQLPTKEDVINHLATKPDFEHNNAELQEKFLGRRISSRGDDQKLYLAFDGIVRRAKEQIAKEQNAEWKVTGHIDLGFKTRIAVFKLVKSDAPLIQENLSSRNLFTLVKTKEVTT